MHWNKWYKRYLSLLRCPLAWKNTSQTHLHLIYLTQTRFCRNVFKHWDNMKSSMMMLYYVQVCNRFNRYSQCHRFCRKWLTLFSYNGFLCVIHCNYRDTHTWTHWWFYQHHLLRMKRRNRAVSKDWWKRKDRRRNIETEREYKHR